MLPGAYARVGLHAPSGVAAVKPVGVGMRAGGPRSIFSFGPLTAVKEANQKILNFIPVTLVRYQVSSGLIGENDDEALRQKHTLADNLMVQPWWGPQYAQRLSPSHEAVKALIAAGFDGLVYSSTQVPGRNLVPWPWNETGGAQVVAGDKHGLLQKNPVTWRRF